MDPVVTWSYLHNRDLIGRWILPSLPEKFNISQLFDAGNGADKMDGPSKHFESIPFKVNEIRRQMEVV